MRQIFAVLALILAFSLACARPHHGGRVARQVAEIDRKVDQVLENQAITNERLEQLIALSQRQGSGEITLFFPWSTARMLRTSDQYDRFVRYLDRLAFEAHGRPILFVAIGSAVDWGRDAWDDSLSRRRAELPRAVAARYLVHVPHRWIHVYGVGERLSPAEPRGQTWRHVRVIAVFDEGQLPELPPKP